MCACIFKEGKQGESSLCNRQHHVGKKREKTPKNTPESPPHRLLHTVSSTFQLCTGKTSISSRSPAQPPPTWLQLTLPVLRRGRGQQLRPLYQPVVMRSRRGRASRCCSAAVSEGSSHCWHSLSRAKTSGEGKILLGH